MEKNNKSTIILVVIIAFLMLAIGICAGVLLSKGDTNIFNIIQGNKEQQENNKENVEETVNLYTQSELEQMALDFYEEKAGYRPKSEASEVEKDGTVEIKLYDSYATYDCFTVNPKNAQGTDSSGNEIDLKNKTYTVKKGGISVKYTSQVVKKVQKGNASYIYINWIPEISGLSENVATNIENYIINLYNETSNEINSENNDDEIMELLDGYDNLKEITTLGFIVISEPEYSNDSRITFRHKFVGGLGGVALDRNSGYSFDKKTGNVLTLGDIIKNGDGYTKIAKNSVMNQLKADERYSGLNEGYEEVVDSLVAFNAKNSVYLREEGLVLIIPNYVIGTEADGEFEFVVKYEELKDVVTTTIGGSIVTVEKEFVRSSASSRDNGLLVLKNITEDSIEFYITASNIRNEETGAVNVGEYEGKAIKTEDGKYVCTDNEANYIITFIKINENEYEVTEEYEGAHPYAGMGVTFEDKYVIK